MGNLGEELGIQGPRLAKLSFSAVSATILLKLQ